MIRLIHRDTGISFWVHESRLDEYLARGHRLPSPPQPLPPPPRESEEAAAPRKTARKTTAKPKK